MTKLEWFDMDAWVDVVINDEITNCVFFIADAISELEKEKENAD